MALKEIFCQDKAVGILQRAYAAGKVPHAYIFVGQDGVGRFATAKAFAKLLLCKKPTTENGFADPSFATAASPLPLRRVDSCGVCESCRAFGAGSHPDFNYVYKELLEFTRDGKDKTTPVEFPIDVVREFIVEKAPVKPTLSDRRIFIVSEGEKLNTESQNCLLKTLEEPPEYCCIILLCTRLEELLPTIKSRCQIVRFGPVDEKKILDRLKDSGIEKTQAEYFARLAEGSIGQACQWAQLEAEGANFYETKKELINDLSNFELADVLNVARKFPDKAKEIAAVWTKLEPNVSRTDINRKAQKILIRIVISALSDAMKLKLMGTEKTINFDQQEQIKKLAERFEPEQAAARIADACKSMVQIDANVNERLIFEQLLLNLVISDRMRI
jgi:DNA polymerase-3 subunit delta'